VILLLFGPPGCGKGTQAAFLAERFHIPAISTGEMFRAECKAGTELGKAACSIISKGGLVGDDVVNEIVASRTARPDCAGGFLLDGYPRTVPQAIWFSEMVRRRRLPEPVVIHLDVADEALVMRLTARRQCPECKRIYNLISLPPVRPGFCDLDGAALVTRDDDQADVIRQRLRAYDEVTGPILKWYGARLVHRVDGSMAPPDVRQELEHIALEASLVCA
jgi:adenylate kinase